METLPQDLLDMLTDAQTQQGFLKAGFLGFPKSGKTYTAAMLAATLKRDYKVPGRVAMFDTEGGSVYIRDHVKKLTGEDLLAKRARSFDDLMRWADACLKAGVSIALVDSITHPWRELCDAYLKQKNEQRQRAYEHKGWKFTPQSNLEFQDWGVLKPRWAVWTDFYLNSPVHIIICGRAGWEYEQQVNESTNKKELVKVGVKMKTESEFGFEPSLLVEMERDMEIADGHRIVRRATVLGDRYSVIDGRVADFPSTDNPEVAMRAVAKFFKPHLDCLTLGAHATIDTEVKSDLGVNEDGDDSWQAEKKTRTILCEEIQGELVRLWPGQSAAEKKAKADAICDAFNTRSWTKVESLDSGKLRAGLQKIRDLKTSEVPNEI